MKKEKYYEKKISSLKEKWKNLIDRSKLNLNKKKKSLKKVFIILVKDDFYWGIEELLSEKMKNKNRKCF